MEFSITMLYHMHLPGVFALHFTGFLLENNGSRVSNKQKLRIKVSVHFHSSILSA